MPVNMDPSKRRRRQPVEQSIASETGEERVQMKKFGEDTDADREKAIADAELKNLWDATEVIDMDNW
ncbi:MAG: hypothetical protein K0S58_3437 [Nitrospira sp.]|nr:hypothetical protein [Nitrospira sp.]